MNQIEKLTAGKHDSPDDGACIMELVSLLANEPWSDNPKCASSSITSFCVWINDSGDQEHRDRLLILAPRIVNTKDHLKEPKRAEIFRDFAFWSAELAAKSRKSGMSARSAIEYAANSAKYAESAARCAARSVDESSKSVEYAARSPRSSTRAAVESSRSVKSSTRSARFAEHAADYATYAGERAIESTKYAVESIAMRKSIYDKAIETLEKVLAV